MIIYGILIRVLVSLIRHVKLKHIPILKIVHVKTSIFWFINNSCKDEILNTTETSRVVNKESMWKKIWHYFINNYVLNIISCIVIISFINCCYFCTKHWIKKEHILLY